MTEPTEWRPPGADAPKWSTGDEAVFDQASALVRDLAEGEGADCLLPPLPSLDAVRIPTDAGELAAQLEVILRRIEPGWGRWMDVGKGWYPLVVETVDRLVEVHSHVVVHQVKEKWALS